jgi:hypothetical protein
MTNEKLRWIREYWLVKRNPDQDWIDILAYVDALRAVEKAAQFVVHCHRVKLSDSAIHEAVRALESTLETTGAS